MAHRALNLHNIQTAFSLQCAFVEAEAVATNGGMLLMERVADLTREVRAQPLGHEFTKFAWALLNARGDLDAAAAIAKRFELFAPSVPRALKAAADAGSTTDSAWAALAESRAIVRGFVELLATRTAVGRVQAAARRVPFNARVLVETSPPTSHWVGEAGEKP